MERSRLYVGHIKLALACR